METRSSEETQEVLRRHRKLLPAAVSHMTHVSLEHVVLVPAQVPGQSEVTHLHQLPFTHQHVPGSQVPVHTLGHAKENMLHENMLHENM